MFFCLVFTLRASYIFLFFFSSRRRHTRSTRDWSSDVCSSDLGRLTQRVHDLEQTRALAVEDAAARLRRLERDLHDGAQIRLATLTMNLGMARKKLGDAGVVPDLTAARELVGAAHQNAKDALVDLRELARGIHPPVLDNGLADALASLTATSALPAELAVSVPVRPTPAIETIAYFCAAELLANAAKHSRRTRSRS